MSEGEGSGDEEGEGMDEIVKWLGCEHKLCELCANTELKRELGMSFDMQLECSHFLEQFENSCLGTNLPGSCLHAEGGNSPPCG